MDTILDVRHELELIAIRYDGHSLAASVAGLEPDQRGRLNSDGSNYVVTFSAPAVHLPIEQVHSSIAEFIQGTDTGFLRVLDNATLRDQLGTNIPPFSNFTLYALITAHKILITLCQSAPHIEPKV